MLEKLIKTRSEFQSFVDEIRKEYPEMFHEIKTEETSAYDSLEMKIMVSEGKHGK